MKDKEHDQIRLIFLTLAMILVGIYTDHFFLYTYPMMLADDNQAYTASVSSIFDF